MFSCLGFGHRTWAGWGALGTLSDVVKSINMDLRPTVDNKDSGNGDYTLIKDEESHELGLFDKPLPCFGCGVGWFSFLSGFVFPLMWYFATILYLASYYRRDPRERSGLAASAIAVARSMQILIPHLINHRYHLDLVMGLLIFIISLQVTPLIQLNYVSLSFSLVSVTLTF
ncbi:hypothetical protein Dimus_027529 [Dionaea muscipula]